MNLSHRARAEGRIFEMSWIDKASYLVKYLIRPELSASPYLQKHFSEQASLWRAIHKPSSSPVATLGFLGDLMWIRKNWGSFLPHSTLDRLRQLDGLVGNLETVVSSHTPVNEFWPDLFLFNSDPRLVTSFRSEEGKNLFAALSFANNHTLDHGDQGARDTLSLLMREGIPQSGISEAGERSWVEFKRKGIRFGFYAATFGLNDPSLLKTTTLQLNHVPRLAPDDPGIEPDLSHTKLALREMEEAGIEVKILALHWGHEFELYPTERQLRVAHELVASGADILLGSHPHIPQPPEVLLLNGYAPSLKMGARLEGKGGPRKALVLYSLGNFVSAMFTPYCRLATLWPISFYRENNGVDWHPEKPDFFYNRNSGGGRELLPLEEYSLSSAETRKLGPILSRLRID